MDINAMELRVKILPSNKRRQETKNSSYFLYNTILFVLACFVVATAVQAVQINRLFAETRALSINVAEVQAQRDEIRNRIINQEDYAIRL